MKIPEEIKSKVKEFLSYIDESPNIKSDDAINKFKELFEGEYIEDEISVNEAYYQSLTKNYYLKGGYGIILQVNSGDWDRYGSSVSHIGKDIVLYSIFSKIEKYRNGYELFFEDDKFFKKLPENIYEIFNIDLSKENLIRNTKEIKDLNSVYKILPDEIKNDKEIVFQRYLHLKKCANDKHREEESDAYISPYYYVSVNSTAKILMEYIENYGDNTFFMDRAFALYNSEFEAHFNSELAKYKNAVYIIEKKDDYSNLIETGESVEFEEDYLEIVKETIADFQNTLDCLIDEYNNLNNKKYSIVERIKSIPKLDRERMIQLGDSELKNGEIEITKKELDEWNNIYREHKEYCDDLKIKYEKIQNELKIPFRDYSEVYKRDDYEKGWEKISLNYLLENNETYKERLEFLESKKENSSKFKEYAELCLNYNEELEENFEMLEEDM